MKRDFNVGDRVFVNHTEARIKGKGTVVAIDSGGDYLVKMNEESDDLYSYCTFCDYRSDKYDLINIEIGRGHKIKLIEHEN